MLDQILFYLFMVTGLINMLHIGFYVVGANLHDIKSFKKQSKPILRDRTKKRPLISVIIPAYNEELSIERCLDSIRANTYRKFEVIVNNDNSSDDTAKIVRAYKKKHPHMALRLVNRRKQGGKAHGVNYCAKKYAQGDLIMTLDADCTIDRRAIKNAVDQFEDVGVIGLAANVRVASDESILSLLQMFEHLLAYRSKMFYSLTNCEFIVGGVASTYRRDVMKRVGYYDTDTQTEDIGLSMKMVAEGNRDERIIYAPNVIATTGGVLTLPALIRQRYRWKLGMMQNLIKYRSLFGNLSSRYSKSLTLYRVPMAFLGEIMLLLEPILLLYILYISYVYSTSIFFVGAYMTITLYVLWTIWPDAYYSNRKKFALSFYAPIMYFVFYIMNLVQIVAILQVLMRPKSVLRKSSTGSHWIPPTRSVQASKV